MAQTHDFPAAAVTIVGAGLAGAACAIVLRDAGVPVRILDRGRAPGGRMSSPVLHDRRVDIGAGYFTVRDKGFAEVVDEWAKAGLARPWTETFAVLAAGHALDTTTGPVRWATPTGLQSLVAAVLAGMPVRSGATVQELPPGEVVLAMPDPQAARLTAVPEPIAFDPVVTVVCGFAGRDWPFVDAAFVHDHADVEFVADDGARRADGAAVLVAHSTADLARRHLDDHDGAVQAVTAGLRELLGLPAPIWTHAHRWTFAKPAGHHDATFGGVSLDDRRVWFAGDQWCPEGSPRVESAWRSGTNLGEAIVAAWTSTPQPGRAGPALPG